MALLSKDQQSFRPEASEDSAGKGKDKNKFRESSKQMKTWHIGV
jgi:hypothetical protein